MSGIEDVRAECHVRRAQHVGVGRCLRFGVPLVLRAAADQHRRKEVRLGSDIRWHVARATAVPALVPGSRRYLAALAVFSRR